MRSPQITPKACRQNSFLFKESLRRIRGLIWAKKSSLKGDGIPSPRIRSPEGSNSGSSWTRYIAGVQKLSRDQKRELLKSLMSFTYTGIAECSMPQVLSRFLEQFGLFNDQQLNNLAIMLQNDLAAPSPAQDKIVPGFSHLTGTHTFGEMMENNVPGVSQLASLRPQLFTRLLHRLSKYAPDAFEVTPPAPQSEELPRINLVGPRESNTTAAALTRAWLYYHYCGCSTYLFTWKLDSTAPEFRDAVKRFNARLVQWCPEFEDDAGAWWHAQLCCADKWEAKNDARAQVICRNSNRVGVNNLYY